MDDVLMDVARFTGVEELLTHYTRFRMTRDTARQRLMRLVTLAEVDDYMNWFDLRWPEADE